MSDVAQQVTDKILARVRDPSAMMHSRALVRTLLTQAQRMVNAKTNRILVTDSYVTVPGKVLYTISTELPASIRIQTIQESGRDVRYMNPSSLMHLRGWFKRRGKMYLAHTFFGRDVLALFPTQSDAVTLSIISTKLTDVIDSENDVLEVEDDDLLLTMDIVELLLFLRGRMFEAAKTKMIGMSKRFKEEGV